MKSEEMESTQELIRPRRIHKLIPNSQKNITIKFCKWTSLGLHALPANLMRNVKAKLNTSVGFLHSSCLYFNKITEAGAQKFY